MEQNIAVPTMPPFPEDATITNIAIWFGNLLLWMVFDPRVRDVVVGVLIPLLGQVIAVTFGEVLKLWPKFQDMRVGDRKFYLRTGPILIGALATFCMLYNYYDLNWAHAGSWMMLALLNGAAAWPVFDRVVEPHVLPWVYRKLAKWSGSRHKDDIVCEQPDEESPDETIPVKRLRELSEKGYGKKEPPDAQQ